MLFQMVSRRICGAKHARQAKLLLKSSCLKIECRTFANSEMDGGSPIKKRNNTKFTETRIHPVIKSGKSTPQPKFCSFDTTWFQRNLSAPSKLQILVVLILAAVSGIGLIASMQPTRFCEFAGDTKCRKCPDYAVCTTDSFTCVSPAVEHNGFCAVRGSVEFDALSILPQVRNMDPNVNDIARELSVSPQVVTKAFEFASMEDRGGLKTTSSKLLLGLFIALVLVLANRIYLRTRAIGEHKKVLAMVGQIENSKGKAVAMADLCQSCNIKATPETRGRMLRELSLHPHFDVDTSTQTIRKV